ncbi:hypothetical protein BJV77DRAFT_711066 [Russula vinacea]|nr:hypothetical protein BJV77DRAFT_711066 [Russula vinacea]
MRFHFDQFYTAARPPLTWEDRLRHVLTRVRLSMRRNSDASRRSDDRYAGIIAAVSQARERIREYEREDEFDAHSPRHQTRSGSFGISTRISEGNAENNLDPQHEPAYLPQTRHVPGTPYPQQQQLVQEQNLHPHTQPEPQRQPSPSNPQPVSAPQIPMFHPVATAPPPTANFSPHHAMAPFPMTFAPSGQFISSRHMGPPPSSFLHHLFQSRASSQRPRPRHSRCPLPGRPPRHSRRMLTSPLRPRLCLASSLPLRHQG